MIPQKQLTLADIFEDCQEIYDSDKPKFLSLLENHIDLDEIIPMSFRKHYYASTGRHRKYPLTFSTSTTCLQKSDTTNCGDCLGPTCVNARTITSSS